VQPENQSAGCGLPAQGPGNPGAPGREVGVSPTSTGWDIHRRLEFGPHGRLSSPGQGRPGSQVLEQGAHIQLIDFQAAQERGLLLLSAQADASAEIAPAQPHRNGLTVRFPFSNTAWVSTRAIETGRPRIFSTRRFTSPSRALSPSRGRGRREYPIFLGGRRLGRRLPLEGSSPPWGREAAGLLWKRRGWPRFEGGPERSTSIDPARSLSPSRISRSERRSFSPGSLTLAFTWKAPTSGTPLNPPNSAAFRRKAFGPDCQVQALAPHRLTQRSLRPHRGPPQPGGQFQGPGLLRGKQGFQGSGGPFDLEGLSIEGTFHLEIDRLLPARSAAVSSSNFSASVFPVFPSR